MPNRAKSSFPQLNRSHPLAQGLVLDAIFDLGSGNKMTDTVNSRTGTPTGTTWVASPFGNAVSFTPTTDKVTYTQYSKINNLTTITYECWFYVRAFTTTAGMRIGGKGSWSCNIVQNGVNNAKSMQFFANWSGSGDWYTDINTFEIGNWYHFISTYDARSFANNPLMYINGVARSITKVNTPSGSYPADAANDFIIGNNSTNIRGMDGIIAYGRYWNRILSAQEVVQLYADPFQIYKKKSLFR